MLEKQGELLEAQKLLLLAGTAAQDVPLLYHVSHALRSAAQELHCLQVRFHRTLNHKVKP